MSKPSERKRRKQKARERLNAKQKHRDREQRRYEQKFPTFRFSGEADPGFEKLVRKALSSIDLRDRRLFHPTETEIYKGMKQNGPEMLLLLRCLEESENHLQAVGFSMKLGNLVFSMIPEEELLRFIPYNDVLIHPAGQFIRVHFSSLLSQSSPGGTIYYSKNKPTIVIDGEKKIVGFSRHAIEQLCNRYGPRWQTYGGMGEVFAVFDKMQTFERCDLFDGQLAFTFFEECTERFFTGLYVPEVLGRPAKGEAYFRVGYCPAVIHGDFISAKTFLFPGYCKTPEYGTIHRADLFWNEKREMIEKATTLDLDTLQRTGDFSLIKFFHDNGVPQVIEKERKYA